MPFVGGPHLNIYNGQTLQFLAARGACRWVIPVEHSREAIGNILRECNAGLTTEILGFGRLPLAFSARCFSARAARRPKDDCGFVCKEAPSGRPLMTQDGKPFLVVNGVQVQSAATQNLLPHIDEIRALGIDIVRISPQVEDTALVIDVARRLIDRAGDNEALLSSLETCQPYGGCDGYWRHAEGMLALHAAAKAQ